MDKPKPMPVQPVDPRPPHSFVVEQPSGLEHLKVPRRRRPCMRETTGKVSRRALPTPQVDGEENLSPRWMRERRDHRIERIQAGLGVGPSQSVVATRSSLASVMLSMTASMGSQTAMTAGVWCASRDASSSRH